MRVLLLLGLLCVACRVEDRYRASAPAAIYHPRIKASWHRTRREILESGAGLQAQLVMLRDLNKAWGYGEFWGLKRDSGGNWVVGQK